MIIEFSCKLVINDEPKRIPTKEEFERLLKENLINPNDPYTLELLTLKVEM